MPDTAMPDTASASAPGRVNLIGEHTDYHHGYVLPTVIPQRTHVHLTRRSDSNVRATSAALPGDSQAFAVGSEQKGRGWLDYVQGVTVMLARHGVAVPGFELRVESTVPLGAGLSSSAALEISLLRAMRQLLRLDLDDIALARIAHAVETEFVGAPVGIMDQMAASLGRDGEALFLDTHTLAVQRLPLPPSLEIIVIDSGVAHAHAGGEYAVRRRESFEAAELLGVTWLRELDSTALPRIERLPILLARRARHIVTENDRVCAAVGALRAGNAQMLGELFSASHASMRDDYETSTPEIDLLVSIGEHHSDVYGARLTGGGFGGAVVMIAKTGTSRAAAAIIRREYHTRSGRDASVLVPQPG